MIRRPIRKQSAKRRRLAPALLLHIAILLLMTAFLPIVVLMAGIEVEPMEGNK